MGWYHADRTGKGILLGKTSDIHFDETFLAKYAPTKEEAKKLLDEAERHAISTVLRIGHCTRNSWSHPEILGGLSLGTIALIETLAKKLHRFIRMA